MFAVTSKKGRRAFLEQTVGEVILEAGMIEASVLINPMFLDSEDEKPKAVLMFAVGKKAEEVLDFYKAYIEKLKDEAKKEIEQLPLMQAAQSEGEVK